MESTTPPPANHSLEKSLKYVLVHDLIARNTGAASMPPRQRITMDVVAGVRSGFTIHTAMMPKSYVMSGKPTVGEYLNAR